MYQSRPNQENRRVESGNHYKDRQQSGLIQGIGYTGDRGAEKPNEMVRQTRD